MKIRYLANGIDEIKEGDVVAAGSHSFFIKSEEVGILVAVPEDFVVSSYQSDAFDTPPSIFEYLKYCKEIKDVDFRLMDLFKVQH